MCRNENKSLSTGLIHQSVKTVGLRQHEGHCQCTNHFPDTSASLQAGHQHNLVQGHCLNLRCVKKTNWWRRKSSCATSWEMRGNQWILNGPFIRVVAVLCGNGCQKRIKTSSYLENVFIQKCKLGKIKMYKCLKHYAGIDPKHPQTIGSTTERRIWRSRALYLQRQTRHHSESSNGCSRHPPQSVVSSLLIVPAKKRNLIRLHLQFLVEKCKTQIFKKCMNWWLSIWRLATMWHWSPFVRPWFHGGAWELHTPIVRLQKQLTPFRTGKPPSALPPIAHTDLEERH